MALTDLSIALVGMGGYGEIYLRCLLNPDQSKGMRLTAAADPQPSRCEHLSEVVSRGIPVYPSLEALLQRQHPDVIVLSTPPQYHAEQVIRSLAHGCHVLCEKPVACEPTQVLDMIAARDKAGKQVAVGYQWSFSPAIAKFKVDVMAGKFGKAKRLRTCVFWPRGEDYYTRNDWAGRRRDSQGLLVLDSPVNNACSHYLHNMFFVLGPERDQSDVPVRVQAELYRAHPIDNYDTAAIRCQTRSGAEFFFVASHATQSLQEPLLNYEFEKAVIRYGGADQQLVAHFNDGAHVKYGKPADSDSAQKLVDFCQAIRTHTPPACGLEAAAAQNTCMFAAQESMPLIAEFPKDMVITRGQPGSRATYAVGLESALNACCESFKLPSEMKFPWARPGRMIAL